MPDLGRLLIVEDTPSLARTYQAHLRHDFSEIIIADTGAKQPDLMPITHAAVPTVDLAANRIVADPPEGLFE